MYNVKLTYHLMPWEIDYALLTFSQLKKSTYYLNGDKIKITIDSVLNLSPSLINWKKSKIPKEYFIEKYHKYSLLIDGKQRYEDNKNHYFKFKHNKKIYKGNKL